MATIKQVAKKAGVSTATVSRVLNGNYPVREKTEQKVKDALKELNYQMNAVAKSLKLQKSYSLALVIPVINSDYMSNIMLGIESIIHQTPYTLSIYITVADQDKEMKILHDLYEKRIDGVILYSVQTKGENLQELINHGLKVILIDRIVPNVSTTCLVEDNEKMTYELVDYALNKGHKKVSIVKGYDIQGTASERFNGFLKALKKNNIAFQECYAVEGQFLREMAYYNMKKMLTNNIDNLPTLIFSSNHHMTEGILMAIKEMGLFVPKDISVISYGNITLPKLYDPKLTVVEQNPYEMGRQACTILLNCIENNQVLVNQTLIINSKIIFGDSIKLI